VTSKIVCEFPSLAVLNSHSLFKFKMDNELISLLGKVQSEINTFRRNYTELPKVVEGSILPDQLKRIQS
jgi:hypothetical protein